MKKKGLCSWSRNRKYKFNAPTTYAKVVEEKCIKEGSKNAEDISIRTSMNEGQHIMLFESLP